jgi:hypothetical protein
MDLYKTLKILRLDYVDPIRTNELQAHINNYNQTLNRIEEISSRYGDNMENVSSIVNHLNSIVSSAGHERLALIKKPAPGHFPCSPGHAEQFNQTVDATVNLLDSQN